MISKQESEAPMSTVGSVRKKSYFPAEASLSCLELSHTEPWASADSPVSQKQLNDKDLV